MYIVNTKREGAFIIISPPEVRREGIRVLGSWFLREDTPLLCIQYTDIQTDDMSTPTEGRNNTYLPTPTASMFFTLYSHVSGCTEGE